MVKAPAISGILLNPTNMPKIITTAPGKLMLMGDHTVVYGQPCLVTAVTPRISVNLQKNETELVSIKTPDFARSQVKSVNRLFSHDTHSKTRFVENSIKVFYERFNIKSGLNISTETEAYFQYGLGSSAAVTVATIYGLGKLFQKNLTRQQVFALAYQTVHQVQGRGSGFDVAAATWGGVLYYVMPGKIIEALNICKLPLVVAYSGQKADTVQLVRKVASKFRRLPETAQEINTACAQLVDQAKKALLNNDWERAGEYMNLNQQYLREMGVSTKKLEDLISAALKAGAYGAKLSGAGGGDCMICLVADENREAVIKALNKAGGKVLSVGVENAGARLE